MNPQLFQRIQLMAMPVQDLRFRIQQEVEANPALEIVEEKPSVSYDEDQERPNEAYEYFENSSDPGYTRGYDDEAGDAKRQFMEGALSRPESLQEHLVWQLRLQPISRRRFELGELLIRNLDENGFHREPPDTLVGEEEHESLHEMMEMIQTFEPVGCCVADYRESLLVQTRLWEDAPSYAEKIIQEYLDLLEKDHAQEIARKLKISRTAVERAVAFIRRLTPFPGRLYSSDAPTYVIPDLLVTQREGQFILVLNDEEIPVLGINPFFNELAGHRTEKTPREVKRFVSSRVKDARWFIGSIDQRNQTLTKVAQAIVEFQRDFFLKGPKYLVPLTLKDIAGDVGVHEATVSRITTNKYIQTEWGIFELKYFFSNSISGAGSGGSRFSKEAVKQTIKEILEEENEGEHLSDRKIGELLAMRGIHIARRTVAKYRKELDISSSYERS
jgi:RNA polymerase sigma-54 factor